MTEEITVLLVDDHAMLRQTMALALEQEEGIRVIGQASSADDAITEAKRTKPDVILMDIDMPGVDSFEAAKRIRTVSPETRIIFLSGFFHDRYIEDALSSEAAGYITKREHIRSVIEGVRAVAAGGAYFSPDVQARLVISRDGATIGPSHKSRLSTLSPRELEVLRYIARGYSVKETADLMGLSVKTVDNHSANIRQKLDVNDRVKLAKIAIREGLVEA